MKKYRKEKLSELLKRTISEIIMERLKDPRIKGLISVNQVEITDDFKFAKVYVSIFGIESVEAENVFKGLSHAQNYIRYQLLKMLHLKYIPKIILIHDTRMSKALNVLETLDQLKEEREKRNG